MKQSLTYYLTLLVLKLKGIKKSFSKDPIDFIKIRKEDIHQPIGNFLKRNILREFKVGGASISEVGIEKHTDHLILFIHGGAFISGPTKLHWDTLEEIAKQTKSKVWMCDYPKAPENKIEEIGANIDAIYAAALEHHAAYQISIIGDSVGGTLITALTQRLILKKSDLPSKIVLVCPVMDASMSNTEIEHYDSLDPMLSKIGVLSAKKMCAGNRDLKDPMISPLYGSFEGFPQTILFLAQHDIMYPDGKLAELKLKKANVDLQVFEGENMPHIWPFLPLMQEAQISLREIIKLLKNES